jgi:hypothetical protein
MHPCQSADAETTRVSVAYLAFGSLLATLVRSPRGLNVKALSC